MGRRLNTKRKDALWKLSTGEKRPERSETDEKEDAFISTLCDRKVETQRGIVYNVKRVKMKNPYNVNIVTK